MTPEILLTDTVLTVCNPNFIEMRKILALFAAMLIAVLPIAARDRVYHNANALPAAARTVLKNQFPKVDVNRIKVESRLIGGDEYEVILSDGTKIEFTDKGEWKEVDCGHKAVPSYFVLPEISDYVKKNYKGQKIIKIEKSSKEYDVELINGAELKFDRAGKFLRIDD